MSFTNVGPVTSIAVGQELRWWYTRNGGADFGFQHAGADVKTPGAELMAYKQTKKIENNGSVTYHVNIRNLGSVAALHNLQGGGVI